MSDENGKPEPESIDRTTSAADLKAAADELLKADRAATKAAAAAMAEAGSEQPGDIESVDENGEEAEAAIDPIEMVRVLTEENSELREKLLRSLADADNIRKRTEREKTDAKTYAIEKFAADLLSVSDNLSRALEALPEAEREQLTESGRNLLNGIEMTEKELHTVLSRHGVSTIPAEPGSAFDPNMHQAVAQIPSEHPSGTIASAFQGGWRIGARTLRAAMVAVSTGDSAS
ncbi:MAG: nucleotide exchange factor GrpE [Pseudomonadota bacterium]